MEDRGLTIQRGAARNSQGKTKFLPWQNIKQAVEAYFCMRDACGAATWGAVFAVAQLSPHEPAEKGPSPP